MSVRPTYLDIPGFSGVHHSLDGRTPSPDVLWYAENVFPLSDTFPSQIGTRPGFKNAGTVPGSGGGRLLINFPTTAGVDRVVAITTDANVRIATWDGDTTWTAQITTAQLTSAGITLSTSTSDATFAVVYNGQLVISDGVNTPFMWDGTSSGGLTLLSNAPVFWGQPVVYYAKLFAIKNTDRRTIVWSEENAANTGYEAGGYSNAWTLTQTDQEALVALGATNEALYYFRISGTGVIEGAVSSDFQSSGVHDGVSREVGMAARHGPLVIGPRLYFPAQDGRPYMLQGRTLTPLVEAVRAFFDIRYSASLGRPPYNMLPGNNAPGSFGWLGVGGVTWTLRPSYWHGWVIFWSNHSEVSARASGLVFHEHSKRFLGFLTVNSGDGISQQVGTTSDGFDTVVVIPNKYPNTVYAPGESLVSFQVGVAELGVGAMNWDNRYTATGDAFGAEPAVSIVARWVTGKLLFDPSLQRHYDILDLECHRQTSAVSNISVQWLTSIADQYSSISTAATLTPTVARWLKQSIGTGAYGRWITVFVKAVYTGSSASASTEYTSLRLTSFPDAMEPVGAV